MSRTAAVTLVAVIPCPHAALCDGRCTVNFLLLDTPVRRGPCRSLLLALCWQPLSVRIDDCAVCYTPMSVRVELHFSIAAH